MGDSSAFVGVFLTLILELSIEIIGSSLVVGCGLLLAVASLVAEHRL